jgi:hypothetical protein
LRSPKATRNGKLFEEFKKLRPQELDEVEGYAVLVVFGEGKDELCS